MSLDIVIETDLLLSKAKIIPSCPDCNDQGFILKVDRKLRSIANPCHCRDLRIKTRRFNAAKIPCQYWDSTLDNFQTVGLPKVETAVRIATKRVKEQSADNFHKGLLLYGKPGTGKTRLICAILREFTLKYNFNARFIEFVQLLNDIKRGYDTGMAESEFLLPLVEVDILAIDELGKGRNSDWEASILDQIVSKRYFAQKTTYFTTNYLVKDNSNKKKSDQSNSPLLTDRVDHRIFSRLSEMTDFVDMDTKDFRIDPTDSKEM